MTTKRPQNHPPRRAPHGAPELTARFQIRLSPEQHRKVMKNGGAEWVRTLIERNVHE